MIFSIFWFGAFSLLQLVFEDTRTEWTGWIATEAQGNNGTTTDVGGVLDTASLVRNWQVRQTKWALRCVSANWSSPLNWCHVNFQSNSFFFFHFLASWMQWHYWSMDRRENCSIFRFGAAWFKCRDWKLHCVNGYLAFTSPMRLALVLGINFTWISSPKNKHSIFSITACRPGSYGTIMQGLITRYEMCLTHFYRPLDTSSFKYPSYDLFYSQNHLEDH